MWHKGREGKTLVRLPRASKLRSWANGSLMVQREVKLASVVLLVIISSQKEFQDLRLQGEQNKAESTNSFEIQACFACIRALL